MRFGGISNGFDSLSHADLVRQPRPRVIVFLATARLAVRGGFNSVFSWHLNHGLICLARLEALGG